MRGGQRQITPRRARRLAILTTILCLLAAGCARGHREKPGTNAPVPSPDTLSNGIPVALARKSAEWVEMWRKAAPGFTPDSLIRGSLSPASLGRSVQPLDHSLVADTDSSVLGEVMGAPSPSGRFVFVADAYRALPDPGVDNPAGGEADEAAVLIDYQQRTCDMIEVCGTPCTYDWGGWMDSTHFALAGSQGDDDSTCYGFLWLYSMSDNTVMSWSTRQVPLRLRGPYYAASQARILARCQAWKLSRRH